MTYINPELFLETFEKWRINQLWWKWDIRHYQWKAAINCQM